MNRVPFWTLALIAFFRDEPGAEVVAAVLSEVPSVEMSAINFLEIAYDAIRRSGDSQAAHEILEAVGQLPIHVHWKLTRLFFIMQPT